MKTFYDKIHEWIKKENIYPDDNCKDLLGAYKEATNVVVKKYVSSTHNWIPGKFRWSKKHGNGYQSPLECADCGLQASDHDEMSGGKMVPVTNIPSRTMHGFHIRRTCKKVLAARARARKAHKGGKCLQCGTYECINL